MPDRTTTVWILLSAITVASWWLAPGHAGGPDTALTVAAALLAALKVRLVLRTFMEVRTAPRWLRLATDAWLALLWAALLAVHLS